jgi:glycosyltransferase involved in cell wall biosynthesis
MSGRPRVSVVVPLLNRERHIGACVESLLAQEEVGGPFEILLVDNGSTDGSASIARRYRGLILLEEATPGAYAARNTAIRRCRAPIVAFTDADCTVDRHWLRSVQHGMEDPGIGILIGDCRYPAGASLALRVLAAYENAKAEYVVSRCPPAYHFAYANNMAVRASLFEEIGPFEAWDRAADTELVHRMARRRPELRVAFCQAMRVTHLEFTRARDRARRLSTYTRTNAKIGTFRELGPLQRLRVLTRLRSGRREGA